MFGKKRETNIDQATRSAFASDFAKRPASRDNTERERIEARGLPRGVAPLPEEEADPAGASATPSGILPTRPEIVIHWDEDEKATELYERPEDVLHELAELAARSQEASHEDDDLSGTSLTSPLDLELVRALIASSEAGEQGEHSAIRGSTSEQKDLDSGSSAFEEDTRPDIPLHEPSDELAHEPTTSEHNLCSPPTLDVPAPAPQTLLPPKMPGSDERPLPRQRFVPTTRIVLPQRGRRFMVRDVGAVLLVIALLGFAFMTVRTAVGDRFAVLHVVSTPADAAVYLDGRLIGTLSPFVKTQVSPERTHVLNVSKHGFRTWTQPLSFRPGETLRVRVTLKRDSALSSAPVVSSLTKDPSAVVGVRSKPSLPAQPSPDVERQEHSATPVAEEVTAGKTATRTLGSETVSTEKPR